MPVIRTQLPLAGNVSLQLLLPTIIMSNVSDTLKNVDSVAAQHGEFQPSTPGTAPAAKTVRCSIQKKAVVLTHAA